VLRSLISLAGGVATSLNSAACPQLSLKQTLAIPTQDKPDTESGALQLRSLMDALVEAMIIINESGEIEAFNQAAEEMFGYTKAEATGENVRVLMPKPDRDEHGDYIKRYLTTGKARIIGIGREVQARRKDGSQFPAHIAIGEVRLKNNSRFVGIVRDLTEVKLAEEHSLRQREDMTNVNRLATLGEMAAAMAHELNQPLSAIANYAAAGSRLIASNKSHQKDIKSTLEKIDAQAHRAGEVIRQMREFTRPSDIARGRTLPSALIEELKPLAELDAKAHGIVLTIDVPDNLPEIVVNSLQIQQVILNLIRNGVDAMCDTPPQDRRLRLAISAEPPESIRIDIEDHGHGIPDEAAKELFDAFFTTKPAGMGMGLAISRTIVRSHGGEIAFANNADGGATFSFTIPTRA
jgi:two-component system sensor kinase FixL